MEDPNKNPRARREVDAPGLLEMATPPPVGSSRTELDSELSVPEALSRRFMTAATSRPPTPAQRTAAGMNQQAILAAAAVIVDGAGQGQTHEVEIALRKLEEALMWANKAVFRA